ncbi:MAG: glycerophosphodiester phosphodiesterase [Acidobacteriota bacterium]|nr:glycerophosphodiester phosphodiesterase [Acidobacteriota bacterium]
MNAGTPGSMPSISTPLILGHRGASAVAPENTLAAFARAIADGADGIEFDVRLSRDHVPVVVHDASLKRTGLIDRRVSELTGAELQAIDVGSWFDQRAQSSGESYRGEKLPTLAEVFQLFSSTGGVLYIEMKCEAHEGTALAATVAKAIEESGLANRVVVASFDLSSIAEIKKHAAAIRTAALFEPKLSRPISTVRRLRMVDVARHNGADEIALHYTLAGPRVIEKAKREGLEVVLWTVDDTHWIVRARSLGIKALISNNPEVMVRSRNTSQLS